MRGGLAIALALLGLVLVPAAPARAAACGLPDTQPLWIDYAEGAVKFRDELFGQPGIIAATSGTSVPQELRALGAQTVYWELKLGSLVGTTRKPADPSTMNAVADRELAKAVAATGCETPLIALNELNGPGTTTPWTQSNATYRANVLALVERLAARGAHPYLLVPGKPYTDGDAAAWWQAVGGNADVVPEVYFNARTLMKQGRVVASRRMRQAFRAALQPYLQIGFPAGKLGLVLGFQSGLGTGGREGLQPTSAWLEFVKLNTLAAKQVASEIHVATVWSWGWGTFSAASADPDKPTAACVYLWARAGGPSLCDAPATAGPDLDPSLTEAQIDLPDGVRCSLGQADLAEASLERLTLVTGDPDVAYTILFGRLVLGADGVPDEQRVLAAERAIVAGRFGGKRSAYLAALWQAKATVAIARGAISDELQRAALEANLRVPPPTDSQLLDFYRAYPDVLVRPVEAYPAPPWLGGQPRGLALAASAPPVVFRLPAKVTTAVPNGSGTYDVTALEEPLPLSAVPFPTARDAIRNALASFARADRLDRVLLARQKSALNRTVCVGDDLPAIGTVSLLDYLPFLALEP